MAHEIDVSTGKAAMAYAGETPWHGLGQDVDPNADLDTWIQEAGFQWELRPSPVLYREEGTKELLPVEGRKVLYRSDNGKPISVVSDRYKIVQPTDVAEFFRDLTEAAGFSMETMGILRGGERYWAMAKVGKGFTIRSKTDVVDPYVLLATSADGSMATVAHLTSVRVVCQNTLQMSVGASGKRAAIQIPHISHFDPEQVKQQLGLIPEWWSQHEKLSKEMAKRSVTREEAVRFFLDILVPRKPHDSLRDDDLIELLEEDWEPPQREDDDEELVQIAKIRPYMLKRMDVFENGVGQDRKATKDTAYGLVNAITRFWDHEYGARSKDNRLTWSWFGGGAREKQDAFRKAAELTLS